MGGRAGRRAGRAPRAGWPGAGEGGRRVATPSLHLQRGPTSRGSRLRAPRPGRRTSRPLAPGPRPRVPGPRPRGRAARPRGGRSRRPPCRFAHAGAPRARPGSPTAPRSGRTPARGRRPARLIHAPSTFDAAQRRVGLRVSRVEGQDPLPGVTRRASRGRGSPAHRREVGQALDVVEGNPGRSLAGRWRGTSAPSTIRVDAGQGKRDPARAGLDHDGLVGPLDDHAPHDAAARQVDLVGSRRAAGARRAARPRAILSVRAWPSPHSQLWSSSAPEQARRARLIPPRSSGAPGRPSGAPHG